MFSNITIKLYACVLWDIIMMFLVGYTFGRIIIYMSSYKILSGLFPILDIIISMCFIQFMKFNTISNVYTYYICMGDGKMV